jgi:hypothetical protein
MFAVFAMVSAVSAVSAMSAVFRHSSAHGDGDGENDRKEGFHGTKVFVAVRSRAFTPAARLVPNPMGTPEQSRGVLIALRDAQLYC